MGFFDAANKISQRAKELMAPFEKRRYKKYWALNTKVLPYRAD
jgi:hypothetical protein